MRMRVLLLVSLLGLATIGFSQTTYPRIVGFGSILHPIVSFSKDGPTYNFSSYYKVGFPFGVNVWKTAKIGYSLQFIPYIVSQAGSSKMTDMVFQPGVMVGLGKGFMFVGRAAFETSGRYGFTPVICKTIWKKGGNSVYIDMPVAFRFGNNEVTAITPCFDIGTTF